MNGEAAAMMLREPEKFRKKVKDYVEKYCKEEYVNFRKKEDEDEDEALSDASTGL